MKPWVPDPGIHVSVLLSPHQTLNNVTGKCVAATRLSQPATRLFFIRCGQCTMLTLGKEQNYISVLESLQNLETFSYNYLFNNLPKHGNSAIK